MQSKVARDVAYAHQISTVTYEYPQELDFEAQYADPGYYQDSSAPSLQYYDETARCWRHTNPNAQQMSTAPNLNHEYRSTSIPTYETYSDRSTALYTERMRPADSRLYTLDTTSPPTSGRLRYEQQGQRAGPWDGVGYVRREESRR